MDVVVRTIEEAHVPGKRLGRHVEHDPLSKNYAFGVTVAPYKTVHHRRYGGVFDQDKPKPLGSCTGNATAGLINTTPVHRKGKPTLHEDIAISIYELATKLDNIPGAYPPEDTGSSGLAAAKAARQMGYISTFRHAFSIEEALSALQVGAVITGTDWYEGFDEPDANGLVKISGQIRGGHEYEAKGFQWRDSLDDSLVLFENSWGKGWGIGGCFHYTVATWRQLLDAQGDVTILL